MSIRVMTYVWEHSMQKGTPLLLLLAIADFADKDGRAYPAIGTLAKRIRMSHRNTQRAVAVLVDSKELVVKPNAGPNGSHLFQIIINETLPLFGIEGGDDKLTGDRLTGRQSSVVGGVTNTASRGDIAMSPEPSGTVIEPSGTHDARRQRRGKTTIPADFGISDQVRTWAKQHGFEPYLDQHLAFFTDYAKSNGRLYADWDGAFRNCIRADWGGIRAALIRQGVKPAKTEPPLTCAERIGPNEICGMPGTIRSGNTVRCDHHERKREEATRRPMPVEARAKLDEFLRKTGATT